MNTDLLLPAAGILGVVFGYLFGRRHRDEPSESTKITTSHVCTSNKCAVCEEGLIENGRYKGHEICSECLIDQIRAVKERGEK